MKYIKYFKYINKNAFKHFLTAYGYKLENAVGFSYVGQKQYNGNILKIYFIHFDDGEKEYFKVAVFKDFNEYNKARFCFSCEKMLGWYSSSWIIKYKTKYSGLYDVTD